MLIFAGLGNPGPKYARHRHNIGYMVADEIIRRYGFRLAQARHHSYVATGDIKGEKILLLKPKTFMNDSGRAVGSALRYYKLKARDITAIYDELDLAPGKVRVKRGGGAGGHNGIRSLDSHIGKDYRRIRIGIGHPGDKKRVHRYVLSDIAKSDQPLMRDFVDAVCEALPILVDGDDAGFMTKVALICPPPKPAGSATTEAG